MIQKIAIIGAGVMGKGIAQLMAQAGFSAILYDHSSTQCDGAIADIHSQWDKLALKNKFTSDQVLKMKANLAKVSRLEDLAESDLVIEAIVENLEVKRELFAKLESIVRPSCQFATNTSSLSVTSIGAKLKDSRRLAGLHFFNPVPLMKVVEVIGGLSTDPNLVAELCQLTEKTGHRAVLAKDTPGFIVNHAGRGYGTEALRIVQENIASFATVDSILRASCQFKMGPFELLDLTGLDVSHPVMESIYHQYYQEPRFRPSVITKQRLDGGFLGRKSGRGFYDYTLGLADKGSAPSPAKAGDKPVDKPVDTLGLTTGKTVIWMPQDSSDGYSLGRPAMDLIRTQFEKVGCTVSFERDPPPQYIGVVTPIGEDVTTRCVAEKRDPKKTIGLDTVFQSANSLTVMVNPLTSKDVTQSIEAAFAGSDISVFIIQDSPGFVAQRVVATIVNVACDMAQQAVATPSDIEAAVTLGLGYPVGPLSWGDKIGAKNILSILQNMYTFYGDPRYRPSPWLKRRAMLGVSLLTI
jgi:3-hydroxybutyryl-CoA dehydrogenase